MHASLSFPSLSTYKYELKPALYIDIEATEIFVKEWQERLQVAIVMALNWLLHSAYNIVLGYPNYSTTKEQATKSMKISYGNELEGTRMDASNFQMPLHYPRYSKTDYQKMEEWRVDLLLQQYGLKSEAKNVDEKRAFAMGAFLWPDQI